LTNGNLPSLWMAPGPGSAYCCVASISQIPTGQTTGVVYYTKGLYLYDA
jgi:hypothetical protein